MEFPAINYLAVLVAAIVIFVLGGLWYSPLLFAKRWTALQNRTEEQIRAQVAASNMIIWSLKFWTSVPAARRCRSRRDRGISRSGPA